MNISIQVFEQDLFLKSREERKKEFTQKCGELGISGNCSGDEYRWPEMKVCISDICQRQLHFATGYSRDDGNIHPRTLIDHTEADIVIFEGTHSLGNELVSYMDYGIYLHASPDLIRYFRAVRSHGKRSLEEVEAIARVAERQTFISIAPNQHRANIVLQWRVDESIPTIEQYYETQKNLKTDPRLEVIQANQQVKPRLTEQQKNILSRLQGSRLLAQDAAINLEHLVFAAMPQLWEGLLEDFPTTNHRLHTPAEDGNCLFTSMSEAHPVFRNITRKKAIEWLKHLKNKLKGTHLPPVLSTLLNQLNLNNTDDIDIAINAETHLLTTGGWGGMETLQMLWAYQMSELESHADPLYIIHPLIDSNQILALNIDGEITDQDYIPDDSSVLVYNGTNHWMWLAQNSVSVVEHTNNKTLSAPPSLRQTYPINLQLIGLQIRGKHTQIY